MISERYQLKRRSQVSGTLSPWEVWEKAQTMTQNHSTRGRKKLQLRPSALIYCHGGGLLQEGHRKKKNGVHASELCCEIADQDLRTSIHTSMNISPSSKSQLASSVKWEVTGPNLKSYLFPTFPAHSTSVTPFVSQPSDHTSTLVLWGHSVCCVPQY